jgi:hypothetical protein
MLTSDTDASLKWCSTPPLWHIDAVGRGVHPIIKGEAIAVSWSVQAPGSEKDRGSRHDCRQGCDEGGNSWRFGGTIELLFLSTLADVCWQQPSWRLWDNGGQALSRKGLGTHRCVAEDRKQDAHKSRKHDPKSAPCRGRASQPYQNL